MIKYLKNKSRNIVHLIRYGNSPLWTYQESLDRVNYNWLKQLNIKTVIDIGACDGDFIKKFRHVFPDAVVYSFEPNPESFKKLEINLAKDKKTKLFNLALSDFAGEIDFFVSSNPGSSSILQMAELHKTNYPKSKKITPIKVKCIRLDDIISKDSLNEKVFMKLDVQGAEKLVLKGAEKTLSYVDIILTEMNFREQYKDSVLANELIAILKNYNFRFAGIDNIYQSLIDGNFMHGDAFFIKEK